MHERSKRAFNNIDIQEQEKTLTALNDNALQGQSTAESFNEHLQLATLRMNT